MLVNLLAIISAAVEAISQVGAGSASLFYLHEPVVPEKLRSKE